MLFCPNCGVKNEDKAKFCENCGARLEGNTTGTESITAEEKMPWEENVTVKQPDSDSQDGPIRPSQLKRARQQEQSESKITFKKPFVNFKKYQEKAKKLTKMQVLVILEVLCLIAVIGIFFGAGSSRNSAKTVAKRFFQAYVDHNWSKMYDLTDYPDGAFLKKAQYVDLMKGMESPEITSFEISNDMQADNGIQQNVTIQYTVKGQGTQTLPLSLIKQGSKSMLFFDTWKVSSDAQVVQEFYINVPPGASLTVDEIALTDSDKAGSQIEGMDSYAVTLFTGNHKLQVSVPWFELYETEFTAVQGEQFTVTEMKLTDEGKTAVEAKMQEALEKIYQAAMANKAFSELSDLFLEDYQESCKESYDYLVSDLHGNKSYTLDQVAFSNFDCEISYGDGYQGMISAEMDFDYDIKYTYSYTSWSDDSTKKEEKTDDGDSYMSASLGFDGETYKLSELGIRSVM